MSYDNRCFVRLQVAVHISSIRNGKPAQCQLNVRPNQTLVSDAKCRIVRRGGHLGCSLTRPGCALRGSLAIHWKEIHVQAR